MSEMGSKKTSKLLCSRLCISLRSKRKSGRKRRGGLEREREKKKGEYPVPLSFFSPSQAICVPAKMSFVSSHQPSPSKFLTMVSQKATGAVQERGSLDIRQRILHQRLGVHCKRGSEAKWIQMERKEVNEIGLDGNKVNGSEVTHVVMKGRQVKEIDEN